jgi:predicted HicB family RNase H-like nuclease
MKPKNPKEERPMLKQMIVRLPADLLRKLKIAAIERDQSLQQIVTDAVEGYLRKEGRR